MLCSLSPSPSRALSCDRWAGCRGRRWSLGYRSKARAVALLWTLGGDAGGVGPLGFVSLFLTSLLVSGVQDGANIHRVGALQPTLRVLARCPPPACVSQTVGKARERTRAGGKRKIQSFNPTRRSLCLLLTSAEGSRWLSCC